MYVVPMKEVLRFDCLPVHEELMSKGILEELHDDSKCVHFISQRWLAEDHPDPDGVKLQRFQEVIGQIIDGDPRDLFDGDDWEAFSTGSSSKRTLAVLDTEIKKDAQPLTVEEFRSDIANGYVWWDFSSIPQALDSDNTAEKQKLAVSSIPYYIERSAYFWVLVPDAMHTSSRQLVGYEDWQSRGWCRLEEWGNMLSLRVAPPLIVTSAKHLGVIDSVDFLTLRSGMGCIAKHAACQGAFTCCELNHRKTLPSGRTVPIRCDKEEIAEVLNRMYSRKLMHFKATGKMFMFWLWRNSAYSVLAGTPLARKPETLEELLDDLGTKNIEGEEKVRKPIDQAVITCSPKLVKAVLEEGASVDTDLVLIFAAQVGDMEIWKLLLGTGQLTPKLLSKGTPANMTALDRCARAGHREVCKLLLSERAHIAPVRKDNGFTPLHTAVESGHPGVCQLLLAALADMDAADKRGRTPLLLAAQRLTLFGRTAGKAPCARLLLEAGADVGLADNHGRLPLEVAQEDDHRAFIEACRWYREERRPKGPLLFERESCGYGCKLIPCCSSK